MLQLLKLLWPWYRRPMAADEFAFALGEIAAHEKSNVISSQTADFARNAVFQGYVRHCAAMQAKVDEYEALPVVLGWRSCDDLLPPIGIEVVVVYGSTTRCLAFARRVETSGEPAWSRRGENLAIHGVTHWTDLPETAFAGTPPRGDRRSSP